jgi:annexin A7/11
MVFLPVKGCPCTLCNRNLSTVKPFPNFNAEEDANALKAAMRGWGCNNTEVTKILGNRSANQRHEIAETFKNLFGKDLVEELKSELGGNFERLVVALMAPWPQYCAKQIVKACKGAGTDEKVLVDILCTANNCQLKMIRTAYKAMDGDELEEDLRKELSGDFANLMVAVCQASRHEDESVDEDRAKQDAQKLMEAGELKLGTDESTFIAVLVRNSYAQLNAVAAAYETISSKKLVDAIEAELSGDLLYAAKTILGIAKNKDEYFAQLLQSTMAGLGTDDKTLISVVVLRSEIDLGNIMQAYENLYGKTLAAAIEEETSGDYKKLLLDIID